MRRSAQLAAAVCADAFMDQEAAHAALSKLVSLEWRRRSELLAEHGWATMPDRTHPEKTVAWLCATKLGEAYTTVRKNVPLAY